MSEMTATRIGVGTLTAVWVAAALLLWRTEVPGGLDVQPILAPFAALDLARAERHDSVLRLLALGALAADLVVLVALTRVRLPLRGPALLRAAEVGALAAAALLVARLPFGLATLWWQRRYGIAHLGYSTWLYDLLGPFVVRAALLGFACAACLLLARRRGPRGPAAAGGRSAPNARAHTPAERRGTRNRADDARGPLGDDARAPCRRAGVPGRARARPRAARASLEGARVVRTADRALARAARPARAAQRPGRRSARAPRRVRAPACRDAARKCGLSALRGGGGLDRPRDDARPRGCEAPPRGPRGGRCPRSEPAAVVEARVRDASDARRASEPG